MLIMYVHIGSEYHVSLFQAPVYYNTELDLLNALPHTIP